MIRTVTALMLGMLAAMAASADTYGRHERVRVLASLGIEVDTRLDPSATVSILRARDREYFNRDGGLWVRFTIDNGSVLPGSRLTVERPVLKDQKIRQRDGSVEHRPTVTLDLCIGRSRIKARLSVSGRSTYTAPLTLGAAEIAKLGAVDAAREYTIEPACDGLAELPPKLGDGDIAERVSPARSGSSAGAAPQRNEAFSCDGRQHCSQMRSRAEAEFFVRNCPNTKMDGDGDKIPCENDSRW